MKSSATSHHVLKSLAELSPELLDAKTAARENGKQQQALALVEKTNEHVFETSYPTASETRGNRGWGIND